MAKSAINAEQLEIILTNVMTKCVPEIIAKVMESFETMVKNLLATFETRLGNLIADVRHVSEKIIDVEHKITEIQTSSNVQPTLSSGVGSIATNAVTKADSSVQLLIALETEKLEREKRRKNVIVTGLQPVLGTSDSDLFSQFCEENLTVKPHILTCRRVGRSVPGKPRLLKITLDNEHSADDLIESSYGLRHSGDPAAKRVYVNRDLTPMEAEAAFEARQKRKTTTGTTETATSS